jgi:hypothetical protein
MTQQFNEVDRAVRAALAAETEGVFASDDLLQSIKERAETAPRHWRRPAPLAVAAVVVLVLAAAVVVATLTGRPDDEAVTAGPAADVAQSTLSVPSVGEASAEQLEDGTPVWVVHHADGTEACLTLPRRSCWK